MSERNPKMSFEEIMQLLELYRQNECLWNHAHCNYKNQTVRNEAFHHILFETNVSSIEEVKRRIKIIRDTYNIEKNKMRKSRLSGPGPYGYYNTKIPWYQTADEFLSKCESKSTHNKTNNASTSYCKTEPSSQESDRNSSPECQEQDSSEPLWQYAEVSMEELISEEQIPSPNIGRKRSTVSTSASVPASTKKVIRPSSSTQQQHTNGNSCGAAAGRNSHIKLIQNKRDSIASAITQPIQDEFLYFGLNLAAQLAELPKLRALQLQEKIQKLVSQERIEFETSQQTNG